MCSRARPRSRLHSRAADDPSYDAALARCVLAGHEHRRSGFGAAICVRSGLCHPLAPRGERHWSRGGRWHVAWTSGTTILVVRSWGVQPAESSTSPPVRPSRSASRRCGAAPRRLASAAGGSCQARVDARARPRPRPRVDMHDRGDARGRANRSTSITPTAQLDGVATRNDVGLAGIEGGRRQPRRHDVLLVATGPAADPCAARNAGHGR